MNKFSVLNPQLMRPVKQGASVTGTNNNISIVNVKRFDPYFNCVAAGSRRIDSYVVVDSIK